MYRLGLRRREKNSLFRLRKNWKNTKLNNKRISLFYRKGIWLSSNNQNIINI
jgi:hypothetical protein